MFKAKMNRIFEATSIKTDTELASVLGIKPPSVAGARKREAVPGDWIEKVAKDYHVSADWLMFGRGPMRPGEQPPPAENAPEPPVTPVETASCARCAEMKAELEEERKERRELSAENRELWQENGDLKAKCATLEERQKTCCPDPPPAFIKKPESGGSPNCAQVCA